MDGRNRLILAVAVAAVWLSGTTAYGYWTDRLDMRMETQFTYPLEITVLEEGEEPSEGAEPDSVDMELLAE